MPVDKGFDALTGHHLGQDWDLFGSSADDVLVRFVRTHPGDVADSIVGFDRLVASSMTEEELLHHWVFELHGGYDPRDDGHTFREWFAHARDVLVRESAQRSD